MKSLSTKVEVPIYKHLLYLSVAEDLEQAYLSLKTPLFVDSEPKDFECQAMWIGNSLGDHAILLKNTAEHPNHSDIAHEVYHCAGDVMSFIGAPATWGGEEAAYLVGWMHEWIYEQLKKARIRIK